MKIRIKNYIPILLAIICFKNCHADIDLFLRPGGKGKILAYRDNHGSKSDIDKNGCYMRNLLDNVINSFENLPVENKKMLHVLIEHEDPSVEYADLLFKLNSYWGDLSHTILYEMGKLFDKKNNFKKVSIKAIDNKRIAIKLIKSIIVNRFIPRFSQRLLMDQSFFALYEKVYNTAKDITFADLFCEVNTLSDYKKRMTNPLFANVFDNIIQSIQVDILLVEEQLKNIGLSLDEIKDISIISMILKDPKQHNQTSRAQEIIDILVNNGGGIIYSFKSALDRIGVSLVDADALYEISQSDNDDNIVFFAGVLHTEAIEEYLLLTGCTYVTSIAAEPGDTCENVFKWLANDEKLDIDQSQTFSRAQHLPGLRQEIAMEIAINAYQNKLKHKLKELTKSCSVCQKPAQKICGGCRAIRYCSSEHQVQDWKSSHSMTCSKEFMKKK